MPKVRLSGSRWIFECPGCGCCHFADSRWKFNGDVEKPTFTPSILVRGKREITNEEADRIMAGELLDIPDRVCHSFVTGGKINFLGDCTHGLKGQTVELPEI